MHLIRTLFVFLLAAPHLAAAIHLPENAAECVRWAAGDLEKTLAEAGATSAEADVAASIDGALRPESFVIRVEGSRVAISAGDATGLMYGLLEAAEQIRNSGKRGDWKTLAAAIRETRQQPYLEFRADNAFCHVKPLLINDVEMWRQYLDMLARNRFNVLDLHGGYDIDETEFPNLYPRLVHVAEYPDAGDAGDQARNLADFKAIVAHAKARGIRVAFMNYDSEASGVGSRKLADYTARAVAALIREVPELYMLGFRVGESGERAEFYKNAYLKGIELSGRDDIRIYSRSWKTEQKTLESIGAKLPGRFDVEIKFNGEQLGLPYHAMHGTHRGRAYASYSYENYLDQPAPYRVIWQVRANGTHRYWSWADTDFIRRTVRTLTFGRARGMSLEPPIAYFPAEAKKYYRAPADGVYRYIWEKHWMWYLAWGRLAYNPELKEEVLIAEYARRFGDGAGSAVYQAMQSSGKIVPLALAYRFMGPDHRHHSPETETGCIHDDDPERSFLQHEPMDTRNFASISEFVQARIDGRPDGRVGPLDVASILARSAAQTREHLGSVRDLAGHAKQEWSLLRADLLAASTLGDYYAERIAGCVHLACALKCGCADHYAKACDCFQTSREKWRALAAITDPLYLPLTNALRAQRKFQWARPLKDLERSDGNVPEELWKHCAKDAAAKAFSLQPLNAPAIKLADVACKVAGGEARIDCKLAASDKQATVLLWHKPLPSQNKWTSTPMTANAGGYSVTIPVDRHGLLYQIEVRAADSAAIFPQVLTERPYWIVEPTE